MTSDDMLDALRYLSYVMKKYDMSAAVASESLKKAFSPHERPGESIIRLIGAPFDMTFRKLHQPLPDEHTEYVFHGPDCHTAYVFVRGQDHGPYTDYWLMSGDELENWRFERNLLAASSILGGGNSGRFRWRVSGHGTFKHRYALKIAGFQWDGQAWCYEGDETPALNSLLQQVFREGGNTMIMKNPV